MRSQEGYLALLAWGSVSSPSMTSMYADLRSKRRCRRSDLAVSLSPPVLDPLIHANTCHPPPFSRQPHHTRHLHGRATPHQSGLLTSRCLGLENLKRSARHHDLESHAEKEKGKAVLTRVGLQWKLGVGRLGSRRGGELAALQGGVGYGYQHLGVSRPLSAFFMRRESL